MQRVRTGLRTPTLLTVALLVSGCAADRPSDAMSTTTETLPNGATLVRHTPPPDGVPVTWRLDEELRIGAIDGGGPDQFGRIGGLAVTDDGQIVVLDAQAQELRVFGADGRHLRTLGRQGGGPGEMEGANGVVLGSDGLLRVPDGRNSRISYFHPDTGFVRSHPYNPVFLTWMFDGVLADDGTLWAVHTIPATEAGEISRTAYVGYDSDGEPVDTIAHPDGADEDPTRSAGLWSVRQDGRLMATISVPFYPRQQHVLDRRLRTWITAHGDPAYRIERRTPDGDVTLVLETERPIQAVQPSDRVAVDSHVATLETRYDATFDRSKIPDVKPAITSFFTDDDGRLWVLASTAGHDSIRTLDSYDAEDGQWLGTLATDLPLMTTPRPVARGDQVWAVVRDELGVGYVVRGRLVGIGEEMGTAPGQ